MNLFTPGRVVVTPLSNDDLVRLTEDIAMVLRVTDVPAERLALVGAARAAIAEFSMRTIDLERMCQLERRTGLSAPALLRPQAE